MSADGKTLAIIGSRNFDDYDFACDKINENMDISKIKWIISGGGSIGVDKLAARFANDNGLPIKIFKPDYKKYNNNPKYAPIARNKIIVEECDVVIAFYYDDSNEIKDAIEYAKSKNKEIITIEL